MQAAGNGVVQAAHRRSWCFCVCGVWLALALVRIRREIREREVHTAAPKVRPHARACAHTRPRHRRGVGERPHVRGSVERTASLAVAKPRYRGGQTRWPWRAEWPLQGIPSENAASGGCGPISTNHVALFGLSCTRFYPAPCFVWPYSNKVHLVFATALEPKIICTWYIFPERYDRSNDQEKTKATKACKEKKKKGPTH